MTADYFLNLLFEEYSKNYINVCENNAESLEKQKRNVADFSYKTAISDKESQKLSRKICAKILHTFMEKVLNLPDVDWTVSKNLKDIYECAVCANSIAQVVERGIMKPKYADSFGLNDTVSAEETEEIIFALRYFFAK